MPRICIHYYKYRRQGQHLDLTSVPLPTKMNRNNDAQAVDDRKLPVTLTILTSWPQIQTEHFRKHNPRMWKIEAIRNRSKTLRYLSTNQPAKPINRTSFSWLFKFKPICFWAGYPQMVPFPLAGKCKTGREEKRWNLCLTAIKDSFI